MQLNPKTGDFTLPSGVVLSSRLTRSMFLSSVEGVQAKVSVKNEPGIHIVLKIMKNR